MGRDDIRIFKNYRDLGQDLRFFYGDDSDNLGVKKVAKVIAYNLQTFEDVEDCFGYLRYVISHDAVMFNLYDRENMYSIFYLLDEIYQYLKECHFPELKMKIKSDLVNHLSDVNQAFSQYILEPNEPLSKILADYLRLFNPKYEIEKNDADALKEELYSIDETAKILKVTNQTVYNYIAEGKLKTIRFSEKKQRIKKEEILRFLNRK